MQRLVKVLPRESLVPEFGYLVFTPDGLIAWNGTVALRFTRDRAGTRMMALVAKYGPSVIQQDEKFLKVLSVLDKVDTLVLKDSELFIKANDSSTDIQFPVLVGADVPTVLPHLDLNWDTEGGRRVVINKVWIDSLDFLTNEGAVLWGDVVGVYDFTDYSAAFDYGLLLYAQKGRPKFKRAGGIPNADDANFCPWSLLQLGLSTMKEAVFKGGELFLIGDGVTYYTSLSCSTEVLSQVLSMREQALKAKKYSATLKFSSNVWKRAKLFNKVVLTLTIKNGSIWLSGNHWTELIGSTDAPDQVFVTRISLLQKWALKSVGHQFAVTPEHGWMVLGRTRHESEFFGSLTMVRPGTGDEDDTEVEVEDVPDGEENETLTKLL